MRKAKLQNEQETYNPFRKPEKYAVGDYVEVQESTFEVGDFQEWPERIQHMIGKVYIIEWVADTMMGLCYGIEDISLPHYCVKKIEGQPRRINLQITEDQLQQIKKTGII